jgi:hypothetical protein
MANMEKLYLRTDQNPPSFSVIFFSENTFIYDDMYQKNW